MRGELSRLYILSFDCLSKCVRNFLQISLKLPFDGNQVIGVQTIHQTARHHDLNLIGIKVSGVSVLIFRALFRNGLNQVLRVKGL